MTAIDDCVLVMIEAIPFDGLMQRHQHLAIELSKFLPVIYVESTPSRLKRVLDGRPFDPQLTEYRRGLKKIGENLQLFKAPPCAPRSSGYLRSIEVTCRRTATALRPHLPKGKRVILWIFTPAGGPALGLYDEALSIFDCFDAWGEFPGEEKYRKSIVESLKKIATGVDIVFATSVELLERLKGFNKTAALMRNGCDPGHFRAGGLIPEKSNRLYDPDSLKRPVIGYMGDIAPWVNLDHLYTAAERHPEWTIVLLGTWKRDKPPPPKLSNVYAPGRVSYVELPYYVRGFDVGTIPFALNELTRVVNPLKLYEYFAIGLPVVATPIPEVAIHENLLYLAGTEDEFVMLLETAVREKPDSPVREKRKKVADENSWKSRVMDIMSVIETKLKEKTRA